MTYSRLIAIVAASALASACATTPKPTTTTDTTSGATTAPPRTSQAMTPIATPPALTPPLIKVGLASDQAEVVFPRTASGYAIVADAGSFAMRRGFTVRAPLANAKVQYGVQIGAISDVTSARGLASKAEAETGQKPVMVFDAKEGLYRIIVGSFPSHTETQPFREELVGRGYTSPLIVPRPTDQPFNKIITLVDDEGDRREFSGESILILPVGSETIRIVDAPYRGGARIFVNSRGLLNAINELNLEDYTRGVVPNEMGPRIFDELEAQKVQALAARTYAVSRLGEYRTEGYDICPTPACQVYKGFSTEEAMSNQAIDATAGMILTYNGKAIDALFTSTCGGMTSDVATMFPGRSEPYLRAVTCVEADLHTLAGRADGAVLNDMQLEARLFEILTGASATNAWSAREVVSSVQAAARFAGQTMPVNVTPGDENALRPPASSRRGEVLRYLADALGVAAHAKTLMLPEDRGYFFPNRPADDPEALAASFLIKFRIVPAQYIDRLDLDAAMPRDELHAFLMSWLRRHEVVSEVTARITAMSGRAMTLRIDGKPTVFNLPEGLPIFRKMLDRSQEYRNVPWMIGDRATVLRRASGAPLALLVLGNYDGAAFDRTSSYSSWVRTYRADELVTTISRRNPIRELQDLRPRTIDKAKRIGELDVIAEGGRVVTLKGLPVRWSLGVPDNLFTFEKSKDPDGVDRYTFFGKGWGHGTGMCQSGAHGMALRGRKAEEIVKHYYTGIEITPFSQVVR